MRGTVQRSLRSATHAHCRSSTADTRTGDGQGDRSQRHTEEEEEAGGGGREAGGGECRGIKNEYVPPFLSSLIKSRQGGAAPSEMHYSLLVSCAVGAAAVSLRWGGLKCGLDGWGGGPNYRRKSQRRKEET